MRLLLISNDSHFTEKLKLALRQTNHAIDDANFQNQDKFWTRGVNYDLVIVEHAETWQAVMFCQNMRREGKRMPLLAIIESLTSEEAIALFNCGVDDYTSKFSNCSEIAARVRAMLRRGKYLNQDKFELDDLVLDCNSFTVERGDRSVHLTKKEFGLLEYLLRHPNQVLSRTTLIEHVWDVHADLFSNSLETHILNLRKKIEAPGKPKLIHTISGRGYKIALQK